MKDPKRVRRLMRKTIRIQMENFLTAVFNQPLHVRLLFAWRIIRGKF